MNPNWRDRAACLGEHPELFFPNGSTGAPILAQIKEAKSVCRRCEVRGECLAVAMDGRMDAGVWGGLSEDERDALRKRGRLAKRRKTAAQRRKAVTA